MSIENNCLPEWILDDNAQENVAGEAENELHKKAFYLIMTLQPF